MSDLVFSKRRNRDVRNNCSNLVGFVAVRVGYGSNFRRIYLSAFGFGYRGFRNSSIDRTQGCISDAADGSLLNLYESIC